MISETKKPANAPTPFTILEQNDDLLQCIALGAACPDLRNYDELLAESTAYGGLAACAFTMEDGQTEALATIRHITAIDPRSNERVTVLKVRIEAQALSYTPLREALEGKRLSLFLGLECTLATSRGTFKILCKTNGDFYTLIHTLKTGKYTRSTEHGVIHGEYECIQLMPVFAIG